MSKAQGIIFTETQKASAKRAKKGFTIIEVSIFLAIAGLLLVGVLGGTYSSIARQRYNDSVRSVSEFFRQMYAEVISPETNADPETTNVGSSNTSAIYGKVIVFGLNSPDDDLGADQTRDNTIYSATLVGNVNIPSDGSSSFVNELKAVEARIFCGNNSDADESITTVGTYVPEWDAKIRTLDNKPLRGTLIIARSPSSGTVHIAYDVSDSFNLKDQCSAGNAQASTAFATALQDHTSNFKSEDLSICVVADKNSTITREIQLQKDGRNTSAVNILSEENSRCQK